MNDDITPGSAAPLIWAVLIIAIGALYEVWRFMQ
jgi:hypothetical protein